MTAVSLAQLAWIAGFLFLGGLAVSLARRGRAEPNAAVGRGRVLAGFALVALLALGGAHAFGVLAASDGLERIQKERGAAVEGSPARARLFLRAAQLVLPADPTHEGAWRGQVGFSPGAALQLPRDYGFAEAHTGRDLLTVEARGRVGLQVTVLPLVSDTRIVLHPDPDAQAGVLSPPPDPRVRSLHRRLLPGDRCPAPNTLSPSPSPSSSGGGAGASVVYAFLCKGAQPRALLVFRRDVPSADDTFVQGAPVRVEPYVFRGDVWKPHQLEVGRGDLLQIGAMADAVPGVRVWEVPAPAGRASLLFPPKDLLSTCTGWLGDKPEEGFFYRGIGPIESAGPTEDPDSFVCVLRFDATIPFLLEVRRLVPDVAGVHARSSWASLLTAAPLLLLLAALLLRPAGSRPAGTVAAAFALATAAAFLAALAPWRLLWAHRLDMLRDFEAVGPRVRLNEVLVVLVAAALAASAALVWPWRRRGPWRLLPAAVAWLAVCVLGGYAVAPGPSQLSFVRLLPQVVFSLLAGTALVWWPLVVALLRRPALPWSRAAVPAVVLAGIGAAGVVGRILTPGAVHAKLIGAWAFVPIAYAALRLAALEGRWRGHSIALGGALLGLLGLATFDAGVTLAVAAPGFMLALAAAAHDATHGERDTTLLDNYRRYLRPLIHAESIVALAVAVVLLLVSRASMAPSLPQTLTRGALYLPFVAALVFALAAFLVARRRGALHATPWIAGAVFGLVLFGARTLLVERSIQSDSQTSKRVAALLDPAYALLRDDLTFARTLTAWREASLGASLGSAHLPDRLIAEGQGYFGAQVVDPGVLLSVENDYLPVLLLRETGARGVARLALLFLGLVAVVLLHADRRFPVGSAAGRARRIGGLVLGAVLLYQPVASLGILPFTGISWPGLGIDSPSDLWVFVALLLAFLLWREDEPAPNAHEERLRASGPFRRTAYLAGGATLGLAFAGAVFVLGAGRFAAGRPAPVDLHGEGAGRRAHLAEPFKGLAEALDYVEHLNLERRPDAVLPALITQAPRSATLRAFDRDLRRAWDTEVIAATAAAQRFLAGEPCALAEGHFRAAAAPDDPGVCVLRFRFGWPELVIRVPRPAPAERDEPPRLVAWKVELAGEAFRALRYPSPRRDPNARFRLKSEAMGVAARDRGELLSGAVVLRMREDADELDLRTATGGLFAAERARLSEDLEVVLEKGAVAVARLEAGKIAPRLFTSQAPAAAGAPRLHELGGPESGWETRVLEPGGPPIVLDRLSVLVTGGASGRTVWLFRPDADPLLADDVTTALGGRRRDYVYGGLLPELGWLNPSSVGRSLGLDGWARAALASHEEPVPGPLAPGAANDEGVARRYQTFAAAYCGTRAVPQPEDAASAEERFVRVCAGSPLDGIMECKITVQPELAIRLKHLLEILSLDPGFLPSAAKFRPAAASSFALLRGDTGEILAQSAFVPGRESTAYAPATAAIERALIAAREDRDPVTGAHVPGEVGAEKADWSQPIAVGSILKPLLASALEWADPRTARELIVSAATRLAADCKHGAPLLGHCPPTETIWEHPADAGVVQFLAQSYNWYQAAIGLLGTGLPAAEGEGMLLVRGDPQGRAAADFSRIGAFDPERPLQTRWRGQPVIGSDVDPHAVNVKTLRQTPMWKLFEAVVGRTLCPNPETCRQRDDLCAARALPLDEAELTADLEHLVTLGPRHFDFWPEYAAVKGKEKKRRAGDWVPVREYFQFLRGSGVHPIGSTLQVADAFNRLFFDRPSSGADPRYRRAASWFPTGDGARFEAPPECKEAAGSPSVTTGLCEVLRSGTAKGLKKALRDPRLVLYGAKTGTIDSLGDVAERAASCRAWNETHTPPDGSTRYHLPDGGGSCPGKAPSDSLLAVGFGVRTADGVVPMTLLLRFQGVRGEHAGFAVVAAAPFLALVADYFGEPARGN